MSYVLAKFKKKDKRYHFLSKDKYGFYHNNFIVHNDVIKFETKEDAQEFKTKEQFKGYELYEI